MVTWTQFPHLPLGPSNVYPARFNLMSYLSDFKLKSFVLLFDGHLFKRGWSGRGALVRNWQFGLFGKCFDGLLAAPVEADELAASGFEMATYRPRF